MNISGVGAGMAVMAFWAFVAGLLVINIKLARTVHKKFTGGPRTGFFNR